MSLIVPPSPKASPDKIIWQQVSGAGLAYSVAMAAQKSERPWMVITENTASALRLLRELKVMLKPQPLPLMLFPDWETLPYDTFSPHQDIISERLATLNELLTLSKGIVIVPVGTLSHRLPPVAFVRGRSQVFQVGQEVSMAHLRRLLVDAGYRAVSQVMEHGEFAVRGSLFDCFPMGASQPLRIDFFGDEIESIKTFDVDSQRSEQSKDQFALLPAQEYPLTEAGIRQFRQAFRDFYAGDPTQIPLYTSVSDGQPQAGVEYYLPLFFDAMATLFDYLPNNAVVVRPNSLEGAAQQFWQSVHHRYEQHRHDVNHPILAPERCFTAPDELFAGVNRFAQVVTYPSLTPSAKGHALELLPAPSLEIDAKATKPLASLAAMLSSARDTRVLIFAETAGRLEGLETMCRQSGLAPQTFMDWRAFTDSDARLGLTIGALDEGVTLSSGQLVWLAEAELFGQQVMQRRRRRARTHKQAEYAIHHLSELAIGAPVVHLDFGVGRYQGLVSLSAGGQVQELLCLTYAEGDKLYVPVTSLHLISRYSGADIENAPLHKLGTDQWEKAKQKAAKRARDVAAELLAIYASRAAKKGYAFDDPDNAYSSFARSFPFEETPDQAEAIESVIADMQSDKAMDRLICGDVGFGKTEVAIRAAFLAAMNGKQTAVLVPTTLLAQQHYETFKDRFADWPVRIAVLSRFTTGQSTKSALDGLQQGTVDIVIGTHKLIQGSVAYHNLGLVIIDEEHRFGVKQKEQLKALRSEVDVLTMTATPIPRTLNLAMSALRDFSVIATPPARRLSVKTFVRPFKEALVVEAIEREVQRGGQVYYLHNEVSTMDRAHERLQTLLPNLKIGMAHGQMGERALESVMSDFYHQRFHVLLCSTIIETGIDVPSANTIIIERADKFGLAQLHQLRGRVGRSHRQAYAYMLTPREGSMTPDAEKRLQALSEFDHLGAGFSLASQDLEIRGAGEILGDGQSGNMQTIGYTLYLEMLDKAVKHYQSGESKPPSTESLFGNACEVDVKAAVMIPEDYLPDVASRLVLYKRLASAPTLEALNDLKAEMIDRFGVLPQQTECLFAVTEIRIKAEPLGIRKIEAGQRSGRIEFGASPKVATGTLVSLMQNHPAHYQLTPQQHLRFNFDMETIEQRLTVLDKLLTKLAKQDMVIA